MFSASTTSAVSSARGTVCLPGTLLEQDSFSSASCFRTQCPNLLVSIWDLVSGRCRTRRRSRYRVATSYCLEPKCGFVAFHSCPCYGNQASHPKAGKLFLLFLRFLVPYFRCTENSARRDAGALPYSVSHCLLSLDPFCQASWAKTVAACVCGSRSSCGPQNHPLPCKSFLTSQACYLRETTHVHTVFQSVAVQVSAGCCPFQGNGAQVYFIQDVGEGAASELPPAASKRFPSRGVQPKSIFVAPTPDVRPCTSLQRHLVSRSVAWTWCRALRTGWCHSLFSSQKRSHQEKMQGRGGALGWLLCAAVPIPIQIAVPRQA